MDACAPQGAPNQLVLNELVVDVLSLHVTRLIKEWTQLIRYNIVQEFFRTRFRQMEFEHLRIVRFHSPLPRAFSGRFSSFCPRRMLLLYENEQRMLLTAIV